MKSKAELRTEYLRLILVNTRYVSVIDWQVSMTDQKKILFLTQLPPPIHGASVVNQSIKDSQVVNENFKTAYVNISTAKEISDIGKFGLIKAIRILNICARILKAYLGFRPDLVYITLSPHGFAFYKDALFALLIKGLGGELVYHLHGKGIRQEIAKSRLRLFTYRSVFRGVSVIHLSELLFSDVKEVVDPERQLLAVSNGVQEVSIGKSLPKRPVFTFIYLSNLVLSKGIDTLIKAFGIVANNTNYADCQLRIIGKPSASYGEDILNIAIEKYNLKNVEYLGPLYGKERDKELSAAHVLVLPTRNDCFPLTILEAFSAGLPVISTSEGAIPSIIDNGVNGIIVEDLNPDNLAIAMLNYLDNLGCYRKHSIEAQNKFASHYTLETFEKNLVKALNSIIGDI